MKYLSGGYVIAAILMASGAAQAADGQAVYDQHCGMCHNNLTPKIGDKDAWAPRIKLGAAALVASVINGKGAMPPRGAAPDLSDDDIKAAVQYLVSKAQ